MVSAPDWRCGGRGGGGVFSWKTKQERRAAVSAGGCGARAFSRISSVRRRESAELI